MDGGPHPRGAHSFPGRFLITDPSEGGEATLELGNLLGDQSLYLAGDRPATIRE